MNQKDFAEAARGRLINAPQGFLAFVPNPLPPSIDFDMPLALSKADVKTWGSGLDFCRKSRDLTPKTVRELSPETRAKETRALIMAVKSSVAENKKLIDDAEKKAAASSN